MAKLLVIASGGALGALLRYGMVSAVYRLSGPGFPWGTLSVNVVGSALIGLIWAVAERGPLTDGWAAFLLVGLLGAFTTYSTFSIETVDLYENGKVLLAGLNVLASNLTCIGMAAVGLWLGRTLMGA